MGGPGSGRSSKFSKKNSRKDQKTITGFLQGLGNAASTFSRVTREDSSSSTSSSVSSTNVFHAAPSHAYEEYNLLDASTPPNISSITSPIASGDGAIISSVTPTHAYISCTSETSDLRGRNSSVSKTFDLCPDKAAEQNYAYRLTEEEKALFQYPTFAGYVNYVLVGLIALAMLEASYMKLSMRTYLQGLDRVTVICRIVGFVPSTIQKSLNGPTWKLMT